MKVKNEHRSCGFTDAINGKRSDKRAVEEAEERGDKVVFGEELQAADAIESCARVRGGSEDKTGTWEFGREAGLVAGMKVSHDHRSWLCGPLEGA